MFFSEKIKTLDEFVLLSRELKFKKKVLVQCDGVFDLLHLGHIRCFAEAKKYGDILYVVLVADKYVQKGPNRPLFDQDIRAEWVAGIECVDFVIINNDYGPYKLMQKVLPDVLVKGSEYEKNPTEGFINDKKLVELHGGKAVFVKELMHSTDIFKKVNNLFN